MLPFSFTSTLKLPLIDGQPDVPLPFNFSGQYKSKEIHDLYFTGAGALDVPMGTVGTSGAVLVVVEHLPVQGAVPILLQYDGASPGMELSPGGLNLYFNPAPNAGVTSLAIEHTAAGRARVWILGG